MPVSGDWTYTESAGDATITDYSGHATPTIPTTLDGYPVIAIASNAMQSKSLLEITIGHTVNLDDNCFASNSGVDVILDANVTTTVSSSVPPFESCNIGSGLTITSNVTSIPNYLFAFAGLSGSLTFPSSITSLGHSSFRSNSISSVTLDSVMNLDDDCFLLNSGIDVILDADITTSASGGTGPFRACYIGSSGLTITSNVTSIPDDLFSESGLSGTLTLPSSITAIGDSSFAANSISSVTLASVMNLDDNCFLSNSGIDVTLDADVTTSTTSYNPPFENCNIGTGLTITSNVTSIPNYLFRRSGLSALSLPSSVTTVNDTAFAQNTSLQYVYIYATSGTYNTNMLSSNSQSDGVIYGKEFTLGEEIGLYYQSLDEYDFESLDQNINLYSGHIIFSETSATPTFELSANVTLTKGNIDLFAEDVEIIISSEVNLTSSPITFEGKTITVEISEVVTDTESGNGLELFLFIDLI